ncbi:hypothetical protein [Bradyrhizobium sp.]|uniref:hypothetical protein n=1 Tax=Bradyrhizobium sp. TaxID=376 RepID=UPI004037ECD9
MKLPDRAGENRPQNTDNESLCADFPGGFARHERSDEAVLIADTSAESGLGQQPVLFRHTVNERLMQKVHRLTDN